jgi:hypothetical protein
MLNKASQAKVRQIAALQKRLDELAAEENTDSTGTPEMTREGDYGRGERGERAMAEREPRTPAAETASGADASIDRTQWLTSYAAFRANFKFEANESGAKVFGWGELHDLKAASEAASTKPQRTVRDGEAPPPVPAEALARVGEVQWEAPLIRAKPAKAAGGDSEVEFRLPPLPRPMKIRFLLDPQESFESWSKLPANEQVKFVGRFESAKPRAIVMRVRLNNLPPATTAPVDASSER